MDGRTHGCHHVRALLRSSWGLGPAVWNCPGGWDLTQGQAAFVPLPSLSQACTGTIPIFIQYRGLPVNPRDLTSRQMWGKGGRDTNAPLCAFCSVLPVSFSCRQTARFVACKASAPYEGSRCGPVKSQTPAQGYHCSVLLCIVWKYHRFSPFQPLFQESRPGPS